MKQSPYFRINYGWPYGTDGWNIGMDENLLTLSFLAAHQVISIVAELPETALEGDAYVLSSDNSARFLVGGTWRIVYPDDGWEFKTSQDGFMYVFEGGVPVQKVDPNDLSITVGELVDRVDNIDTRLERIDTTLVGLEDIPQRVEVLELTSAKQGDLQSLTVRVDALENEDDTIVQRIADVELNVDTLEGAISLVRDDLDQKVDSVVGGTGISVDNTDPLNPIISATGSEGASSFVELDDTPSTYNSAAGAIVAVNAEGTGLEFLDRINGGAF